MKNILKFALLAFIMLYDFVAFAQPGDDDGGGGVEDVDPQPAPINSKLILLLVIGLIFAYHSFKKNRKHI
jgi:hypothetical protein